MLKEKQGVRILTLTESIVRDRYCSSQINIESQLHSHEFYEFAICADGVFDNAYNLDGASELEKGLFFLARPGEIHKVNQKRWKSAIEALLNVYKHFCCICCILMLFLLFINMEGAVGKVSQVSSTFN